MVLGLISLILDRGLNLPPTSYKQFLNKINAGANDDSPTYLFLPDVTSTGKKVQ